jgi:hypothetical protein
LGRQKGVVRTKVADEGLPQRGQFRPYRASSAAAARRQLTALATWLERNGQADAAASLREGLEETLTVLKLGLPPALRRFFATTNCIENLIGTLSRGTSSAGATATCDGGGSGSACCAPPSALGASSGITSSARSSPRSRPRRPRNVPHESS